MSKFKLGDKVRKIKGYKLPGVIVSVFETTEGNVRYVVECTVPEVKGLLHIYSEKDLELDQIIKNKPLRLNLPSLDALVKDCNTKQSALTEAARQWAEDNSS